MVLDSQRHTADRARADNRVRPARTGASPKATLLATAARLSTAHRDRHRL